jgi:hypothetical protein
VSILEVDENVKSDVDTITPEIVEQYRIDHPGLSDDDLYKLTNEENSGDGLPPFWDGNAFESIEFRPGEYDGEPIEPCTECGGELASAEECEEHGWPLPYSDRYTENATQLMLDEAGKQKDVLYRRCDCDQDAQADEWRKWLNDVRARWDEEKESRESATESNGLSAFVLGNPTLTNVALEISRCCNVPEELVVCEILSAISAAIGKGLVIEYKRNGYTPLGLYIIGYMMSGGGKSASMMRALKPVYDKQIALHEQWKSDCSMTKANLVAVEARLKGLTKTAEKRALDSKEARELEQLQTEVDKLKKELAPPSLWMQDFTIEAQRNVLNSNAEQVTMLSDDAGRQFQNLLGLNNKLQMVEDQLLLAGYTGSDFVSDRVSSGHVFIPKVWCSLFWLAQPDKIQLLTENAHIAEGGFLARCLMARFHGEACVQSDDDVSLTLMAAYDKVWSEVFSAYREQHLEYQSRETINVSGRAREFLKYIEEQIVDAHNSGPAAMRPFSARWMENLWRIAGVLHVARHLGEAHKVPVSEDTARAAANVLGYFRRQQEQMLGARAHEKQRDKITKLIDIVLRSEGERITMRELGRKGWDEKEVLSLVKQVPRVLVVVNKPSGENGGRPSVCLETLDVPLCYRDPQLAARFRASRDRRLGR